MTLKAKSAAKASLFNTWSPILRWIQEIVIDELDSQVSQPKSLIYLQSLHEFCSKAADLPRAFLLAVICHQALLIVTEKQEARTYGKISSEQALAPWKQLLRKLRVCLIFTLRLHHHPLSVLPITVSNIESNSFSIYSWIARDELDISHSQEEISVLEHALSVSGQIIEAYSSKADSSAKTKLLQQACSQPGMRSTTPLLLLFPQYNDSVLLASHRALLLAEMWGASPNELNYLEDAAHTILSGKGVEAAAVTLEIWQTRIRPVFRGLLFGFDDVTELTEEIVSPLCEDDQWLQGLATVATKILSLLSRKSDSSPRKSVPNLKDQQFPIVAKDIILESLITKLHPIDDTSLDLHLGVIQIIKITPSYHDLLNFLPEDSEPFLHHSIFIPMLNPALSHDASDHLHFLTEALRYKAEAEKGPIIDCFDEDEIRILSRTWGFCPKIIRSNYLLQMYSVKKDTMVDDLFSSSLNIIDFQVFLQGGFDIACLRLHKTLSSLQKVRKFRGIIGMLDADTCQWIKERSKRLGNQDYGEISLAATYIFILKLMKLSIGGEQDPRDKAQALSILSGMLLNAMKDIEVGMC